MKALNLTQEGLSRLLFYHKNFSKHFKLFQNRFFRQNKDYPLDYIHGDDECNNLYRKARGIQKKDSIQRENTLKNIVMMIILK